VFSAKLVQRIRELIVKQLYTRLNKETDRLIVLYALN